MDWASTIIRDSLDRRAAAREAGLDQRRRQVNADHAGRSRGNGA